MESTTEAQRRTLELVGAWLRGSYPEVAESKDGPVYLVRGGPNAIRVRVLPIGEDQVVVDVYTWVGHGLTVDDAVRAYLLERNAELRFPKLAIDGDGDILLADSLFPEQLGAGVLVRLVDVVAATADEIEGELAARRPGGAAG